MAPAFAPLRRGEQGPLQLCEFLIKFASMAATKFEFEKRFWIICAIYLVAFLLSVFDHTPFIVALRHLIAPSITRGSPDAGAFARIVILIGALLVFSLVVGFGGSFISLLMSKPMAKWSTGAQVIDGSEGAEQRWLVDTVHGLAAKAGNALSEVTFQVRALSHPTTPTRFSRNQGLAGLETLQLMP